jgi:phage gp36-like protein
VSYAAPADLIARKSVQTLGDLCSDSGTRVTPTGLLSDPNLQAALDSASGEIDAALLVCGRYQPSDLTGLAGNAKAHLVRICCEIAWCFLLSRKPTYESEQYKAAMELQDVYLERLRKGENVFNVAANIAAGTPKFDAPSVATVESKLFIRDRTQNYFPARTSQSG